jgi:phage/plasmid-like protein (TIGR03299 family)
MVYLNDAIPHSRLRSPFEGVATAVDADKVLTSKQVMVEAGLDWRVNEKKLFTEDKLAIDSHKALVRADTNSVLGVVGDGYEVLQNSEAFAFVDSLVAQGRMKYAGAGTFNGGKRIFIQCDARGGDNGGMGMQEIAKDDPILPYALFVNSHDGSSAVLTILTAIRVVCRNTLNAAINSGSKKANSRYSIKHTKSLTERLQQAKIIFGWAEKNFTQFVEDAKVLAKKKIDKEAQLQEFLDAAFEVVPTEGNQTQNISRRERLTELFETGEGNTLPAVRGTAWAAVNAVTQFLDHESRTAVRGVNLDDIAEETRIQMQRAKRLESNMLGNNANIKERAFSLALAM